MARNKQLSGTELLRSFEQQLRQTLPSTWTLVADVARRSAGGQGIAAELELSGSDSTRARLLVETKRVVEPRDVATVLKQIDAYKARKGARSGLQQLAVVVAPYLSPMARERLAESGAGWFDATGNLRLQLERPGLFIDRVGATRSPFTEPDERRLQSLRGAAAARVVRSLLDGEGPRGVRALAAEAEVSNASSSRVLELLARADVIARDDTGAVVSVRKRSLARRWAQDYGLTTTNHTVSMLAPRGIDRLLTALTGFQQKYALTGSAAAQIYLPAGQAAVAPLALPVVFVADAGRAQDELDVRPTDRGGNVLLVEPFDDVVLRGAASVDGLQYVAPSQTVVDLLSGPGRSAEEAEQLLDVLARNDPAWTR